MHAVEMMRILDFFVAGLVVASFPSAHAEETPAAPPPEAIPEKEWNLVKDSAEYAITSDPWFAEITKLAATKPAYSPGKGIGDGGVGEFGSLTIKPADPEAARKKWFEIAVSYSSTGSWDRQGRPLKTIRRFYLVECSREGDLTRMRQVGAYTSEPWLKRIVEEVLKQSHAVRKPSPAKLPNGSWVVENTRPKEAYLFEEALHQAIEAGSLNPVAPGEATDSEPMGSAYVFRDQAAASAWDEAGPKAYHVSAYRDGRMKIQEASEKDHVLTLRDLGWIQDQALREKIRHGMIKTATAREQKKRDQEAEREKLYSDLKKGFPGGP